MSSEAEIYLQKAQTGDQKVAEIEMQLMVLDEIEKSNRELIKLDVLKKQADGHYSKLVNYYNSQRDLNRQLAQSNSNLSSILKKARRETFND